MLLFREALKELEHLAPSEIGRNALPRAATPLVPEQASLDQISRHHRILLLQGPNGPFFARVRDLLLSKGCKVSKVNFNGGDDFYYGDGDIVRFTSPMPAWKPFLEELIRSRGIDAVVAFGTSRRHHRVAARVAQEIGVAFWAFEEGYVRPDYITLEVGGVNADSPLAPLRLEDIPTIGRPPKQRRFTYAFRKMAWQSFCYFATGMLGRCTYPHYRHHKPFGLHELVHWGRAGYRKHKFRWQERELRQRLLASDHPHFFLVALQVYTDSQIRVHSPWRRIEDFIEWTIHSFASHAPADSLLVFKHHPMDRGHTDYAATIAACAARFGATGRVVYLHDAHLPSLLHRCMGLVTVNSTTGLQALFHRVPVIALGRCFYAKPGLTFQGTLDAFWNDPQAVDMTSYKRFRNYLIHVSQINSSFYADDTLCQLPVVRSKRPWHRHLPARLLSLACLVTADAYSGHFVDLSAAFEWLTQALAG